MTPVGSLDAEKTVEAVFLYVFRIAFTASPYEHPSLHKFDMTNKWCEKFVRLALVG